jgi:gliding motility-associated-like protein
VTTYLWTKTSGPAAVLGAEGTSELQLSALVLGTYTFRIEVIDDMGASSSDDVTVTVAPPGTNSPPLVLAGGAKTIVLPTTSVVLSGSASDNDGSVTAVEWTQTDGPNTSTLTDVNSVTLTAANLVAGHYTFRLTATDNESATAFSETTVDVKSAADVPIVFAGNDTILYLPDNAMELFGTATSSEGFITTYTWTQTEGDPVTMTGDYPEVFLTGMLPGAYRFVLTVLDDKANTASDDVLIEVVEGKSNPIGAAIVFTPNGDLMNDVWVVRNTNMIQGCPIAIFNSLGKKVYAASEYQNDWNGSAEGQIAREGDYYFVFECGNNKTYSGALRLVR